MMNQAKVVALSGVSGAGKTTIVKQLANQFSCPFLLFDDYIDKSTYPQDMKGWLDKGANVSLIKTPRFVESLENLILKNCSRFIFVEEPFGKERNAMSSLIDYVVLLDQPMELCLARIIKRHCEVPQPDSIHHISNYLNKYDDHFRDIYISAVNQVRGNSDLIVNDVTSIENTTEFIGNWLKNIAN